MMRKRNMWHHLGTDWSPATAASQMSCDLRRNLMVDCLIFTSKLWFFVRVRTDRRLLASRGTCNTLVNSIWSEEGPFLRGQKTIEPTPAAWSTLLSARRTGTLQGLYSLNQWRFGVICDVAPVSAIQWVGAAVGGIEKAAAAPANSVWVYLDILESVMRDLRGIESESEHKKLRVCREPRKRGIGEVSGLWAHNLSQPSDGECSE